MTVTGLHHLTQLTGCTRPSAGACTFPIGLVTGCSVLTQAALQTVSSIKPRRAFWEKTYRKNVFFTHQSPVCVLGVFVFSPTFCAAGPSPAWRARALPTGRVADAIVTAATGLVTSFPIGTRGACCQRATTISLPLHELR